MNNKLATVACAAALLTTAPAVFADCTAVDRPATAAERKIHADGFALFQQVAPPAPAGWTARDSPADGALPSVCADAGQALTRWTYSRSYQRTEGVEQRRAEAARQTEAALRRSQEMRKANEAKLAANQQRMDENMKKAQALMTARNQAGMEKIIAENEALMKQSMALMGAAGLDAEIKSIEAAAVRDVSASFSLTIGESARNTDGFTPMAAAVGRGFRQDFDSNGNPKADRMVIVGPAGGGAGSQTVVLISGDPARADALLKTTKLQLLPR